MECQHENCTRAATTSNLEYFKDKWLCTYHANIATKEGRRKKRILIGAKSAMSNVLKNGLDAYINDGVRFGFFDKEEKPIDILDSIIETLSECHLLDDAVELDLYKQKYINSKKKKKFPDFNADELAKDIDAEIIRKMLK